MTEIKMTETKKLVPVSILNGTRISREEEKSLGAFSLDGETVRTLGEESVGVFVGSSPSRRRLPAVWWNEGGLIWPLREMEAC